MFDYNAIVPKYQSDVAGVSVSAIKSLSGPHKEQNLDRSKGDVYLMKIPTTATAILAAMPKPGLSWLSAPSQTTALVAHECKPNINAAARLSVTPAARSMRLAVSPSLSMQRHGQASDEGLPPGIGTQSLTIADAEFRLSAEDQVLVQTAQRSFALPKRLNIDLLETVEYASIQGEDDLRKTFTGPKSAETDYIVVSIKSDRIEMMWDLTPEEQEQIVYSDEEDVEYFHHLVIPRNRFSEFLDFINYGEKSVILPISLTRGIETPLAEPGIIRAHNSNAMPFG